MHPGGSPGKDEAQKPAPGSNYALELIEPGPFDSRRLAGPEIVPGCRDHRGTDWVQINVTVTDEQPGFALNEARFEAAFPYEAIAKWASL